VGNFVDFSGALQGRLKIFVFEVGRGIAGAGAFERCREVAEADKRRGGSGAAIDSVRQLTSDGQVLLRTAHKTKQLHSGDAGGRL
jgi:hypothetical protein